MDLVNFLREHAFNISVLNDCVKFEEYDENFNFTDDDNIVIPNIFDNEYTKGTVSCLSLLFFLEKSVKVERDVVIKLDKFNKNYIEQYHNGELIDINDKLFDILPNCMYMLTIELEDETHFMILITTEYKAIVINSYGGIKKVITKYHDMGDFIFLWKSYINSSLCNKGNGDMKNIVLELVKLITGIDNLMGDEKYFLGVDLERIDNIEEKQYMVINDIKYYLRHTLYPYLKTTREKNIVKRILKDK